MDTEEPLVDDPLGCFQNIISAAARCWKLNVSAIDQKDAAVIEISDGDIRVYVSLTEKEAREALADGPYILIMIIASRFHAAMTALERMKQYAN